MNQRSQSSAGGENSNRNQHREISEFCVRVGSDPLLVQGGGGNVSWKQDDVMWIKGSGTWLSNAGDRKIFTPVDLTSLQQALAAGDFSYKPQALPGSDLRPSIETVLHGLMPHRIVAHLHAIEPLAHLVRQRLPVPDAAAGVALVPYATPGADLATAAAQALAGGGDVHTLLLANHGIVVGADDLQMLQRRLDVLLKRYSAPVVDRAVRPPSGPVVVHGHEYTPVPQLKVHALATDPALFSRLSRDWALYPDHVVFLGPAPVCARDVDGAQQMDSTPTFFFLAGVGVFAGVEFGLAHQLQLQCYYDVLSRQTPADDLRTLGSNEVATLLDWDAERYRQEMANTNQHNQT